MTQRDDELHRKILDFCTREVGVLNADFLCRSVSSLGLHDPITVTPDTSLADIFTLLRQYRIGCVLVVDSADKLVGIFSERDAVLKVAGLITDLAGTPVRSVMTTNPVSQEPTATTAFALNLMSLGGFRHLPIVDPENHPIGIISVKDIVDSIVRGISEALSEQ